MDGSHEAFGLRNTTDTIKVDPIDDGSEDIHLTADVQLVALYERYETLQTQVQKLRRFGDLGEVIRDKIEQNLSGILQAIVQSNGIIEYDGFVASILNQVCFASVQNCHEAQFNGQADDLTDIIRT